MNKKIVIVVPILIGLQSLYLFTLNSIDENHLASRFMLSGVYFDDNHVVKISYLDKSNKTNSVILEIEGLRPPFQKKYANSSFIAEISVSSPPLYGWKTTPVTSLIDHKEFGKFILKSELTPYGEPSSKVIYSRP